MVADKLTHLASGHFRRGCKLRWESYDQIGQPSQDN
ncbi:hypothetical protein FOQG_04770 [Fusarium oxysporum f. sp. raphani 54005]|uniref:Uncharacterized protein n=3 Tax=Fusarium oxysporum TaxID=5507 RepID=X0CRJ0_FUSOX|nr:hypothetical protein FOVG_01989 [Fusarium oxysporum f. sp. pisi HDV247]EXK93494.1 hypothetical protein FOQG_04770 [Fusarium oxysporum f. sp. raphani 54005]EXL81052.1 hypothetical protein FOPG_05716 [Fusarium oxysporum f. sp. conglutinans race 2 54008]